MLIEVDGTRLFVDVVGPELEPAGPTMKQRPTLLVLHGGPGADHTIHRPSFDCLSDVAQVLYVDQRGQGRSAPAEPREWNLARWGDDIHSLCEALGVQRPIILGHSFGGMVAMSYGIRHPEAPIGLVFSCTYARQNIDRTARRCLELGGEEVANAAREMWAHPTEAAMTEYNRLVLPFYMRRPIVAADIDSMRRASSNSEIGLHFARSEMQSFDFLSELNTIRCPTLVIGAALDPVCPIEDQQELFEALPAEHRRFERLEDCSHIAWEDDADRYFAAVRGFIAELGDAGGGAG